MYKNGLVSFKTLQGETLQKMSLRSGRSSPLTSPVLQEPAKHGGRGTSKSKYVQNLVDSASHSLILFEMQPCRCDTSEDELKEWEEFSSDISNTSRTC